MHFFLAFQPKLLETKEVVEAIEGKPITMSCKFFASPLANVNLFFIKIVYCL